MIVSELALEGLLLVELQLQRDARGFFVERFSATTFAATDARLPTTFAQVNHSRSLPGVLRGLHYQHTPPQGKLVGVTAGAVLDVAVDIRPDSSTFGQHVTHLLTVESGHLLWLPPGFAHGFCVVGTAPADVLYLVDTPYAPRGERGLRFDDAALAIDWPIAEPLVSPRDQALPTFDHLRRLLALPQR